MISDAWGNVIDEVHYYDSEPWPEEADGDGPYLQLIDLDLDNSLAESWTVGNDVTGLNENSVENQIVIYPNPTNGVVNLKIKEGNYNYDIFDISGRKIAEGKVAGENARLDLQNLENGLYLLNINGLGVKQIILSK